MNIFDLKLNKSATSAMDVLHPATGESTGMAVAVRSVDHPKVQAAVVAFNRTKPAGDKELSIEEQLAANAESTLELAVAMVESWTIVGSDGKAIPSDAESVRALLGDDDLSWLRDAIASHGLSRKNYFRGSVPVNKPVGSAGRVAVGRPRKS